MAIARIDARAGAGAAERAAREAVALPAGEADALQAQTAVGSVLLRSLGPMTVGSAPQHLDQHAPRMHHRNLAHAGYRRAGPDVVPGLPGIAGRQDLDQQDGVGQRLLARCIGRAADPQVGTRRFTSERMRVITPGSVTMRHAEFDAEFDAKSKLPINRLRFD